MSTPSTACVYFIDGHTFTNLDKAQKHADELNNERKRANLDILRAIRIQYGDVYVPYDISPQTPIRIRTITGRAEVFESFQGDTPEDDALIVATRWNLWNGKQSSLSERDRTLFNKWMGRSTREWHVVDVPTSDHLYP